MTREYATRAAEILRGFADGKGITYPQYGACSNFASILRDEVPCTEERTKLRDYLEELFPYWPKFSGDEAYPIPGGREEYDSTWDKWIEEYGDLRKELCTFCAEQFEKYTESVEI